MLSFFVPSPYSDAIILKQSQVDKLYASLKDLAGERRGKLDEVLKLYMLNREIEDLEQWIAEREVVAGSHELGQDFEHVTVGALKLGSVWLEFWESFVQEFQLMSLLPFSIRC